MLVSTTMIARPLRDSWSELLTSSWSTTGWEQWFPSSKTGICCTSVQSGTESWALACHP